MAQWHAKGLLRIGQEFIHESFIGSIFKGTVEGETVVGGKQAILPGMEGWSVVTGMNTVFLDDDDPFVH